MFLLVQAVSQGNAGGLFSQNYEPSKIKTDKKKFLFGFWMERSQWKHPLNVL